MRIKLTPVLDVEFFNLEQAREAELLASETNGVIYSWKTVGRSNWLERRLSNVDVLGLVVLPRGLPETIELPDDEEEDVDESA